MNASWYDDSGAVINYYDIFNLPHTARADEVRTAFCALIKRYHTDCTGMNSDTDRKKIALIISAYKLLSDRESRARYDRALFPHGDDGAPSYPIIPRSRVKYSFSLADLLRNRLLNPRMKRRDYIHSLGQDVEILVTSREAARGAIALVELPSRSQCPLCLGRDRECNVCRGVGRIQTTNALQVAIRPGTPDGTVMDFDLMALKPDRFTSFTMRSVRIKITVGAASAR